METIIVGIMAGLLVYTVLILVYLYTTYKNRSDELRDLVECDCADCKKWTRQNKQGVTPTTTKKTKRTSKKKDTLEIDPEWDVDTRKTKRE